VSSHQRTGDLARLAGGLVSIAAAIVAFRAWLGVSNPTIAALTFLLVVLVVASTSRLWVAFLTAFAAMLGFNYFFLPPVGAWTIADPQNWVALFVFLAVSLIASNLSAAVRARAQEAQSRRHELARLFDLSRDILVMTGSHALAGLARSVSARFSLDYVAIALPGADDWDVFEAGSPEIRLDRELLSRTFAGIGETLEFDARARTYSGQATADVNTHTVRIVPLRVGTRPIGLLAAAGRPIEPGTLDALAGIVAIAIERARFLDERKTAEVTRQSEELKSALLASIGHDLRTPLTAIRVAASNLQDSWLGEAGRRDQADVILTEVERLTRLFQNILSMAKIDAGPIEIAVAWAVPSDILAAARDQVEQALRHHHVEVSIASDVPVRLDPKLTATALAHVLENAAQYSPEGATIRVAMEIADGELRVAVHDAGPGISPTDVPHVFDRFYRGDAARARATGTGMGLSIARGLLAAERGRIWVENDAAGGAVFTIAVPVELRAEETAAIT
jgi:two-component system sensor histidine kinase KdpD